MTTLKTISLSAALIAVGSACGAELVAESSFDPAPITAIALYKNGLAVVTRRVTPQTNGVARVDGSDVPAYGTLWHTAAQSLALVAEKCDVLRSMAGNDWARDFVGRKVMVYFRSVDLGAMLDFAKQKAGYSVRACAGGEKEAMQVFSAEGCVVEEKASPKPAREEPYYWYNAQQQAQRKDLVLKLPSGSMLFVPAGLLVAVKAEDGLAGAVEPQANVWTFSGAAKPFDIEYVTAGASWTPSYRLELAGEKGRVSMAAELRNELMAWKDVEVSLVSGFPNLTYASVPSLLGGAVSFDAYRRAIEAAESGEGRSRNGTMSQAMSNSLVGSVAFSTLGRLAAATEAAHETGAGADIHYRPVGKVTLGKNETLRLPLGTGEAAARRLVDWDVDDLRDQYGRRADRREKKNAPELWDAVKFANPFKFPMTTAPMEVTEEGRVLGQALVTWTNPGDDALVKITKALSVKGSYEESEKGQSSFKSRDEAYMEYRGIQYRKKTVTGTFCVQNFRATPVTVVLKKRISGEIVETSLAPQKTHVLPPVDFNLNSRRDLTWEFELKPGEKKEIKLDFWLWVG